MENYILDILKSQLMIVFSWGFNSPRKTPNGLMFKVQGFIHTGWVKIEYNEGSDLFDITLLDLKMKTTKELEGVYFDVLVETIDCLVERVINYDERVKNEYSLL